MDARPPGSFLDCLEPSEYDQLRAVGRRRDLGRGEAIFREGDTADSVVIVLDGHVKVTASAIEGRDVVLGVRGPGELLGDLSAIDGGPRSATVSALDDVGVLVIARAEFRAFLDRHPRVAVPMMELLARRLREASTREVEFGGPDTLGRLAARLVELAEDYGREASGGTEVALTLTQQELADWTALSRETVVKGLQAMRELGWVATGRRRITVLDLPALKNRADTAR